MKILASTIDAAADTFLHAGYISAYPPDDDPLSVHTYVSGSPDLQLDVVQALSLKQEMAAFLPSTETSSFLAAVFSPEVGPRILGGMAIVFAGLILIKAMKTQAVFSKCFLGSSLLLVFGLSSFAGVSCRQEDYDLDDDDEISTRGDPISSFLASCDTGKELQEYEDPKSATLAILHGILVPAQNNIAYEDMDGFESIWPEAGLPTTNLTEGMKQALGNYCYDGWGQRFIWKNDSNLFLSIGEDGQEGTDDDISQRYYTPEPYFWRERPSIHSFYSQKISGEIQLYFHSFSGKGFSFNHEDDALENTGGNLFDLWKEQDFAEADETEAFDKLVTTYNEMSDLVTHEPLVLQVFGLDS